MQYPPLFEILFLKEHYETCSCPLVQYYQTLFGDKNVSSQHILMLSQNNIRKYEAVLSHG